MPLINSTQLLKPNLDTMHSALHLVLKGLHLTLDVCIACVRVTTDLCVSMLCKRN